MKTEICLHEARFVSNRKVERFGEFLNSVGTNRPSMSKTFEAPKTKPFKVLSLEIAEL